LQFKEAALLAQKTAAAEKEGKTQTLLFAMLQDQHAKQIVQMEATNKTNMDTMMVQMNALVAARDASGKQYHPPLAVAPKPRNPGGRKPSVSTAMFCNAQGGQLFQARSKQGIALPRMEVYLCRTSNRVTGTGDITN
jgi:hypothetical protein